MRCRVEARKRRRQSGAFRFPQAAMPAPETPPRSVLPYFSPSAERICAVNAACCPLLGA